MPISLLLALSLYLLWGGPQSELVREKPSGKKFSQSGAVTPSDLKKDLEVAKTSEKKPKSTPLKFSSKENFSYKKEVEKVIELADIYPSSRKSLIFIAAKQDIYKQDKLAEPHTMAELRQNKMGAVKVLALKALISRGQGKREIMENLNDVIAKAKDPTILKIARAARESAEQGRPFFEDFSDAIEAMPL